MAKLGYPAYLWQLLPQGKCLIYSDAGTGDVRAPMFGRPVNPFPTGKGRLSSPITTGIPN